MGRHMRRRAAGDTCEQSPELDAPYVQLPKANLAPLVVRTDDRHVVGGLGAFLGILGRLYGKSRSRERSEQQ